MTSELSVEVLETTDAFAKKAAQEIAAVAREAIEARGRFLFAVSGSHIPWLMLREFAAVQIPWPAESVSSRRAMPHDPDISRDQSREIVTGAEIVEALNRRLHGDPDIPASGVDRELPYPSASADGHSDAQALSADYSRLK